MVLWYYGIMVLWYYGIMVLWYYGIMVLVFEYIYIYILSVFLTATYYPYHLSCAFYIGRRKSVT
jgi:hypothetical protein